MRIKPESTEEVGNAIARQLAPDRRGVGARLVQRAGQSEAISRNREDVGMRVGAGGGLDSSAGGFFEAAEAHECHGA